VVWLIFSGLLLGNFRVSGTTSWSLVIFLILSLICHGACALSILIFNSKLITQSKEGSLYLAISVLIFIDLVFCVFLRKDLATEEFDDDEESLSNSFMSDASSEFTETSEDKMRREVTAEKFKNLMFKAQPNLGANFNSSPTFISEKRLAEIRSVDVVAHSESGFFRFFVYDGETTFVVIRNFKEFINFYMDVRQKIHFDF
jgi:hypothetical protein